MKHILDLQIDRFRGMRDAHLPEVGAVNLIVGGNNTGKTSTLEAIELVCHPLHIWQLLETSRGRDRAIQSPSSLLKRLLKQQLDLGETMPLPIDNAIEWLFPLNGRQLNEDDPSHVGRDSIGIKASIQGVRHEYEINFVEAKMVNALEQGSLEEQMEMNSLEVSMKHVHNDQVDTATFLTTDRMMRDNGRTLLRTIMVTPVDHRMLPLSAKSLTDAIRHDKLGLIRLMQLFDPDIVGIDILSPDGGSAIPHLEHRTKSYIPVSVFGDGMRRVLTLASAVIRARGGVLLIDEIETALHPRMLGKVFDWLVDACEQHQVQLFASTHSLEAVDAILEHYVDVDLDTEEVTLSGLDNLVAYRLIQQQGLTEAKRYSGEKLYSLRNDYGQDVR